MNQTRNMTPMRSAITLVVVAALAFLVYAFLTRPDDRSFGQRMGDAIHALPQGPDKASEQLEDRTPGQKLGDTIKDNTGPHE